MCAARTRPNTHGGHSEVVLRTGARVKLRPVVPTGRPRGTAGDRQPSDHTSYSRFFGVLPDLSGARSRPRIDLDHHGHEAIGAEDLSTGHAVGVARYVRSRADPSEAEVAVAVRDDWEHTGVGTALLGALAQRAGHEQIGVFTAEVLAENQGLPALLAHLGDLQLEHGAEDLSTLHVRVPLDPARPAGGR